MEGLTVSEPAWLSILRIKDVVAGKGEWIAAHLARLEAARRLAGTIALPALAENWQVRYRQSSSETVAARTIGPGTILVSGALDDDARCKAALRRWLARRAKEALGPLLQTLAAETGLRFSRLTVKNQRSRWGSCSPDNGISLSCKLLFLPADLARYVLLHELCHTREHNHTARYWSLLRQHEPEASALHQRIRAAWRHIPFWAHPVRGRGRT
jgi:predicted metal-dependent hydrolase